MSCAGLLVERQRRRQHELERDEADVDDDQMRRLGRQRGDSDADVGLPPATRPRAARAGCVQLPAADIDRVDAPGAALQQHLREAAGRGADIEADHAARIEAEMIERGHELQAAARHVRMRRARAQFGVDRDFLGRFAHDRVVGAAPDRLRSRPAPWRGCRTGRARPADGRRGGESCNRLRAFPGLRRVTRAAPRRDK